MESPSRKPSLIAVLMTALLAAQALPAAALTADIVALSPADGSWTNRSYADIPFRFTFSDPANAGALCTLHVSGIVYGPAPAGNGTTNEFFLSQEMPQGRNQWNVSCENGTARSSPQMELFYDRVAPSVSVFSPADASQTGAITMNATFYFTDAASPYANCTLYANGSNMKSGLNFQNSAPSYIAFAWSHNGTYAWNVGCVDNAGNTGTSAQRTITVALPAAVRLDSPGNKTYDRDDIEVRFHEFFAGSPSWMGYSLDGGAPVELSGNATVIFSSGSHTMELTVNETSAASQKSSVSFTVSPQNPIILPSLDDAFANNWLFVNASLLREASWCGVSADGEANATMNNAGAYSWDYTFYGLPDGAHQITVHCNHSGRMWSRSASVGVYLSPFTVGILSPQNATYWKSTSADVYAVTGRNASSCTLKVGNATEVAMGNQSPASWNYSLGGLSPGTYSVSVRCVSETGLLNASNVSFTVTTDECMDSVTGICTGAQECIEGMCSDIECSGCAHAANHACVPHECCADTDCLKSHECFANRCVPVECPCGTISEHACAEYECCSNFDCGENNECDADAHKCVTKKLILMAPDMTVGEQALIRVLNHNGESMPGVRITIEYEDGSTQQVTTGEDGTALFTPSMAGEILMTARIEGYETDTSAPKAVQPYTLIILAAAAVAAAGGAGTFLYFTRMSGQLLLSKTVSGQDVTIRVRNRGEEQIADVFILDSVPAGAFIGCSIEPGIEQIAGEMHLTWSASLDPGEEIVITYQAAATSKGFSVRTADKYYHRGGGIFGI